MRVYERPIGDLLAPTRPGSVMGLVNQASMRLGQDVAGWRVDRLRAVARWLGGDA